MRRAAIALAIACSLVPLVPGAAAAGVACQHTIAVTEYAFTPAAKTTAVTDGVGVCWRNDGELTHTATSNNGFFDTGDIAPAMSVGAWFYGSGTYAYHCTHHAEMTGTIGIRPTLSDGSITLGQSVTLKVGSTIVKGWTWDVQRKRNDGAWVTIKDDTGLPSFSVQPGRAGRYWYRARTMSGGNRSGWSPTRKLVVSAP
jgi:plastocyanin